MDELKPCDECGVETLTLYRYLSIDGKLEYVCFDCRAELLRGPSGFDKSKKLYEEANAHKQRAEARRVLKKHKEHMREARRVDRYERIQRERYRSNEDES